MRNGSDGTEIFRSLQFAAIVQISFYATVSREQSSPTTIILLYGSHPTGGTLSLFDQF